MPTSSPALARPSPRVRKRRVDVVATALAVVVGAALMAGLSQLLADPARVDLEVDNPTAYDVNVDVRPADGGNRIGLGTVGAGSSKPFARVIDQGERWLFEFSYGGVDASPVEVSQETVTSGTVVVPARVEEEFRDAGLNPPPS